jgi:hypothetical protein
MKFFDPKGIGLNLICISILVALRYPGSVFVNIQVEQEGNFTGVNVRTREWEYQVNISSGI